MRALFFAFMIALLLLRGWVGDAMANRMALAPLHPAPESRQLATPATAAAQTAHKTAHKTAHEAAHDCAGHAAHDDSAPAASAHCPSCDACQACQACQACHSVALTSPAARPSTALGPRTQPPAPAARFASADAAPGQKPPIS